jgi:tryptophanyl-tRNA synthetase
MSKIFSGIQPSGDLHIGNYLGAVKNWVELQHKHDILICIVDYHAITQDYDVTALEQRTIDMATGLLAAGIEPDKCTLFVQSHVPEHTELAWTLMSVTPLGELERMTQFKDKSKKQESIRAGLMNYPVLQAADVLLYKADRVPVGEDQVQHLELMREIARKWNARFGENFFPEPEALLTTARRVMGLDGNSKMSKSMGNTIGMLEEPEDIWQLLRPAVTDPARVRKSDPGDPDKCNLYSLHKYFGSQTQVAEVATNCRGAAWGCIDCKKVLSESIAGAFEEPRARAAELRAQPDMVRQILADGAARARAKASETMREVRDRMGLMKGAGGV